MIFKSDFGLERLNLNSYEKKSVCDLRELYFGRIKNDNYELYKTLHSKTDIAIAAYYVITGNNSVIKFLRNLKQTKIEITGIDLLALGLRPSPLYSEIFEKVLEAKLNGSLKTKKDELDYVMKNF